MKLIHCRIAYLVADDTSDSQTVFVQELAGERTLAIGIGPFEAQCIQRALKKEGFARPLTHDLLLHTIAGLGGSLLAVAIVRAENGTYFAELRLGQGTRSCQVDCRPSDALALHSRVAECQLLVADELLDG
jgi:uncharacterized protein